MQRFLSGPVPHAPQIVEAKIWEERSGEGGRQENGAGRKGGREEMREGGNEGEEGAERKGGRK